MPRVVVICACPSCAWASFAEPPASCRRVAWVRRKLCQLTHGRPILRAAGLICRSSRLVSLKAVALRVGKTSSCPFGAPGFSAVVCNARVRKGKCSLASLRFGSTEASTIDGLLHAELASFEVQVLPTQAQDLPYS